MRQLLVVALDERIKSALLLEHIARRGLRGFLFEREMHPRVATFCSGWPGLIRSTRMRNLVRMQSEGGTGI